MSPEQFKIVSEMRARHEFRRLKTEMNRKYGLIKNERTKQRIPTAQEDLEQLFEILDELMFEVSQKGDHATIEETDSETEDKNITSGPSDDAC